MTGRCSKCKEMCEAELNFIEIVGVMVREWVSNCCGAPLIEDGERGHEE